jgi:hypothetical protein
VGVFLLVNRRETAGGLQRAATLTSQDRLESPLLPGFELAVGDLFV